MLQVDNRGQQDPLVSEQQAIKLCDRNFGIGADGVRRIAVSYYNSNLQTIKDL